MAFLRSYYDQILGPRRYLPKLANGVCRYSDVPLYLDAHLIWQAAKSYVERGSVFGLVAEASREEFGLFNWRFFHPWKLSRYLRPQFEKHGACSGQIGRPFTTCQMLRPLRD
jgi:hypothetical protein